MASEPTSAPTTRDDRERQIRALERASGVPPVFGRPLGTSGLFVLALGTAALTTFVPLPVVVALAAGEVVLLAVALVLTGRDRRALLDLFVAHAVARTRDWRSDTGGDFPPDRAAAEIWLGAHQAGSVPDVYRALAADRAGDPRAGRLAAALPRGTAAERADRAWVAYLSGGDAGNPDAWRHDATELGEGVPDAPRVLRLALMEASVRLDDGDRDWAEPVTRARPSIQAVDVPRRMRVGTWRRLLQPAIVLALDLVIAIAAISTLVPSARLQAYRDSRVATRGAATDVVSAAIYGLLPDLDAALVRSRQVQPSIGDAQARLLIRSSLPTMIWEPGTHALALSGANGRHVSSVEVLAGASPPAAIVTWDDGSMTLESLDPGTTARVLAVLRGEPEPRSP